MPTIHNRQRIFLTKSWKQNAAGSNTYLLDGPLSFAAFVPEDLFVVTWLPTATELPFLLKLHFRSTLWLVLLQSSFEQLDDAAVIYSGPVALRTFDDVGREVEDNVRQVYC